MELSENQLAALKNVADEQEKGGGNFLYAKPKTPALVQLEAKGLVEHNASMTNADGKCPFRLTPAGATALAQLSKGSTMDANTNNAGTAPTAPASTGQASATPNFAIAAVALPGISRGGAGGDTKYPFSKLQPGYSFFEPLNGRKNLSKTLGSLVGKQNKLKADEQYTTRSMADGAPWGEQFKGVPGVAVFRLTAEQIKDRDERKAAKEAAKAE